MTLEANIEKLTDAVVELTKRIHSLEAMIAIPPVARLPEKQGAPAEQKTEPPKADKAKAEKPSGPSVDDLQNMALAKVREDRTKKGAIKELIASYGNAKVIADIPAKDLAAFAKELEAL